MNSSEEISERIAETLRSCCTNSTMPKVAMEAAGLVVPPEEPGVSKRERARAALVGKSERELAEIARRIGAHLGVCELEELGNLVLERGEPPITEITRRDIAKCFGADLSGERNLLELLRPIFPTDGFGLLGLELQIERHMILNPGDWSVEDLFTHLGALSCSRNRFGRILESALHPLSRRGTEQEEMAKRINALLGRDGYELAVAGDESGYPIFRLTPLLRGVVGRPKNLIFASSGPKPEIGFRDAINNDIVILSNADSCLIYDRPIGRSGLRWTELVGWWREQDQGTSDSGSAARLGKRLQHSLDSDAEKNLFATYFRLYRERLGDALPALIPQVYLHYDPAVVKELRRRAGPRMGLPRQRMDFLLLLSNNQRIVLEVDGSQHFSSEGKPSLSTYAAMVAADRDLRLGGYEIFRFGANELVGGGAQELIEDFFDRLWVSHKVNG